MLLSTQVEPYFSLIVFYVWSAEWKVVLVANGNLIKENNMWNTSVKAFSHFEYDWKVSVLQAFCFYNLPGVIS